MPNCTRPTSRSGADESDTSAILCEKYQWTIDRSNYDQVDVRVVHKDRVTTTCLYFAYFCDSDNKKNTTPQLVYGDRFPAHLVLIYTFNASAG